MSDTSSAQEEATAFLATVPLLDGIPEPELAELARAMRRRQVPAGGVLWRGGDVAEEMLWVFDGAVRVVLPVPGERVVEIATLGAGEVLGEVPLLDGGVRWGTATVTEDATLLVLGRADFLALVSRRNETAFAIKRRIAGVASARLRLLLSRLAESLGDGPSDPPADKPPAELEFCGPPDSGYIGRLATFHAFDTMALWGFLTAGKYARVPAGRTLFAEGSPATHCYVTINGAVERVIIRGDQRVRVGLAGPGHCFGYEGLIDGGPSPATAITRERTLLLLLEQEPFARLFGGETGGSHPFLDVIHRDQMAATRQALRPHAHLAV